MDNDPDSRGRRFATVLVRRRWLVGVGALVAVLVALAVSFASAKVYGATAKVIADGPAATTQATTTAAEASNVATHVELLKSQATKVAVSQRLGNAAPLVTAIHIEPVGRSRVIDITAESADKGVAAQAATTYAQAYVDEWRNAVIDSRQKLSQNLQQRMQDTKKQLDDADAKITAAVGGKGNVGDLPTLRSQRDSLQAKYNDYKARYDASLTDTTGDTGVRVLQEASVPSNPVRPRPVRNALIGLILGVLVGIGAAFVFETADDAVRNTDDIRRHASGKRVLGTIPAIRSWKDRDNARLVTAEDPASPASEAYRSLRTSVQFALAHQPGRQLRTILVTSPSTAEGKTVTVANLAIVLARSGRRVVCVDCDLRHPRLHKFFGLDSTLGFTSVLLGDSPLSASLQQVSVAGGGSLRLLAAGPLPPNPAELLETSRVSELLAAVQADSDVVVIDGTPLLPVTDALALATRVDGVVLATALHITSRRALTKAVHELADAGARLLGIVLNGGPSSGSDDGPVRAPAADRGEPRVATSRR